MEEDEGHAFVETKARQTCDFCGDDWPAAELVVKYFECGKCNMSVHKGCQAMASMCEPCISPERRKKVHRRSSSSTWGVMVQTERRKASKPVSGRVVVNIIRAHDLIGVEGSLIYCTARLNTASAEIKTDVSYPITGGSWDVSKGTGGNFGGGGSIPNALSLEQSMFVKSTIPKIQLSLWRSSWVTAFDSSFASCNISLFPLLSRPGVTAERWFSVRSPEGDAIGKVLLNIVFLPQDGNQSRSRTTSQESVELADIIDEAGGAGVLLNASMDRYDGAAGAIGLGAPLEESVSAVDPSEQQKNKHFLRIRTQSDDAPQSALTSPTRANSAGSPPMVQDEEARDVMQSWVQWGDSLINHWTGVSIKEKAQAMANDVMKMSGLNAENTCKGLDGPAIGKLRVHLHSATHTGQHADHSSGNYSARVSITHADLDESTHVVWQNQYQNCNPHFDKYYQFDVPHFQSGIGMSLIDHTKGTVVGKSYISISSILIRDADKYDSQCEMADYEEVPIYSNLSDKRDVVGFFRVRIRFQEDLYGLFTSAQPHDAQIPPDEDLSLERLRTHIARFRAYIGWFYLLYEEYCKIMDWSDPILSGALFVLYVCACLFINAEYGFCAPLFVLVLLHTRAYYRRKSGAFKQKWVEKGRPEEEPFRPLAYLRLAVREFKGLNQIEQTLLSNMVRNAGSNLGASPRHLEKSRGKEEQSPYSSTGSHPFVKVTYSPAASEPSDSTQSGSEDSETGVPTAGTSSDGPEEEEPMDSSDELEGDDGSGPQILGGLFSTPARKERPPRDDLGTLEKQELSAEKSGTKDKEKEPKKAKMEELLVACLPPMSDGYDRVDAVHPNQQSMQLSQLMNTLSSLRSHKANDAFLYNFHYPWPHQTSDDVQTPFRVSESGLPCDEAEDGLIYPIQQPVSIDPSGTNTPKPVPWTKNRGFVTLRMYGDDPFASFIDSHWGSVAVPISSLVGSNGDTHGGPQEEVDAWFDIDCRNGVLLGRPISEVESSFNTTAGEVRPSTPSSNSDDETSGRVQVRLRMQLVLRDPRKAPTEVEVKKSNAFRDILAVGADSSGGMLSGLLGMRTNIQYVQNLMAYILNFLESFKNVLNWTVPSKTYPLYLGLILAWIATVLIPGRYLLLGIGLYEFLYCFFPQPEKFPIVTRFFNLLESVPNDDELERVYAEENAAFLSRLENNKTEVMRWGRLNLIHTCRWSGNVRIKGFTGLAGTTTWDAAFLVIQGRRLVWWTREEDLEASAPIGHILLYGHAGTTQSSPVDIREIGDDTRLLTIFGMDVNGKPNRRTIITKDTEDKIVVIKEIARVLGQEDDLEERAWNPEAEAPGHNGGTQLMTPAPQTPLPLADKKRQ